MTLKYFYTTRQALQVTLGCGAELFWYCAMKKGEIRTGKEKERRDMCFIHLVRCYSLAADGVPLELALILPASHECYCSVITGSGKY